MNPSGKEFIKRFAKPFVEFASLAESCWVFAYLILIVLQLYFLGKIGNAHSSAVNSDNEEIFNQGLKHLYYYSVVGIIAFIGGFIMSPLNLIGSFKYYKVI